MGQNQPASPLRIAILGTGGMAEAHAKALRAQSDARIVAVCGTSAGKAGDFIQQHASGAAPYDNFAAMLDAAQPDAVYITIPPFAHDGQTELAASLGIHLFLEKPIALSSEAADHIAVVTRRAGVISQVGFCLRHGHAVRRLQAAIADGSAGRPTLFYGSYRCNSLHKDWWHERSKSGGQVYEQIVHLYDLTRFLLGEPELVWGQIANLCHRDNPAYTIEDTSIGTMRFVSGAMATIAGSNGSVPGEWRSSWSVVCERLTAHFTDCNHAEFIWHDSNTVRREQVGQVVDVLAAETVEFLAAIRARGRTTSSVADAARSTALVDAVIASSEAGGIPVVPRPAPGTG